MSASTLAEPRRTDHAPYAPAADEPRSGEPEAVVGAWTRRFESIYSNAGGDIGRVPWAHRRPSPSLLPWLNVEAPCLVRPGGKVVVVGCGLGHDMAELCSRGFDVVGFDACPSAVEWGRTLFPDLADRIVQADLMNPPSRWRHRFDLVVEVHTLQSLPPCTWGRVASSMVDLLGPHGVLLSICRHRQDEAIALDAVDGPPFEPTAQELVETFGDAGLVPTRDPDVYDDDNDPPMRRLRCAFRRTSRCCE